MYILKYIEEDGVEVQVCGKVENLEEVLDLFKQFLRGVTFAEHLVDRIILEEPEIEQNSNNYNGVF